MFYFATCVLLSSLAAMAMSDLAAPLLFNIGKDGQIAVFWIFSGTSLLASMLPKCRRILWWLGGASLACVVLAAVSFAVRTTSTHAVQVVGEWEQHDPQGVARCAAQPVVRDLVSGEVFRAELEPRAGHREKFFPARSCRTGTRKEWNSPTPWRVELQRGFPSYRKIAGVDVLSSSVEAPPLEWRFLRDSNAGVFLLTLGLMIAAPSVCVAFVSKRGALTLLLGSVALMLGGLWVWHPMIPIVLLGFAGSFWLVFLMDKQKERNYQKDYPVFSHPPIDTLFEGAKENQPCHLHIATVCVGHRTGHGIGVMYTLCRDFTDDYEQDVTETEIRETRWYDVFPDQASAEKCLRERVADGSHREKFVIVHSSCENRRERR